MPGIPTDVDKFGVSGTNVTIGDEASVEIESFSAEGVHINIGGPPGVGLWLWFYSQAPLRRLYDTLAEHFAAHDEFDETRPPTADEAIGGQLQAEPTGTPALSE